VALTADATSEAAKECRDAGMDACLTKPVETKKLLEVIASLVPAAKRPADGVPAPHDQADAAERGREIRPALDPATVDELKALGGSGDFFGKLVAIFLEAGAQKIREMEKAAAGRRYGQFRDIAHAMKGSAGQVGAFALMEICNEFSRIGPANHEEDAAALLERLKEEFDRVAAALRESAGKPGSAVS
jgi:two-component system sensor histidine kinase RpfC